ncbi:unnamed protein product [Paramecium pentaurelia]|uniref:Trichocyst matrix protein n=1 Tax=Paramecium pentaurelia TaxID=43138 RepID=A0A8S1S7I9_9CILI|nr:unnamed protein product [Paramecium pentaurelia]
MRVTSLLLILLINSVIGTKSIYEISQNEYGKTVLQAIQLTLNEEPASFGRTIDLLQELKKGIQNDQDEDSGLLAERLETCETHISQNSQTISDSQTKLAQAQEQVGPLEQKLLDKRHQAEDKEGEEQRNNDRINKLILQRQESRQQFESKRDELTSIVGALSEAKKIIGSIKTDPTALIQLKNHKENILNQIQKSSMFYTLIHSTLSLIQQGTSQEKVIRIIDDLIDEVYQVQKLEMIADDQREADFIKTKIRFEFANTRLNTKIAELRADVQQLQQQLLELNNNIAIYQDLVNLKTKENADWQQSCNDAQNSHNGLTDYRTQQITIIDECISLLQGHDPEITQFIQRFV